MTAAADRIGQAGLVAVAVLLVCLLSGLALIFALVCAPPLRQMAERVRD